MDNNIIIMILKGYQVRGSDKNTKYIYIYIPIYMEKIFTNTPIIIQGRFCVPSTKNLPYNYTYMGIPCVIMYRSSVKIIISLASRPPPIVQCCMKVNSPSIYNNPKA